MTKTQPAVKYKRKKVLINKPFQLRFALYLVGILLAAFCVAGINFYFGIWDGVVGVLTDGKFCEDFLSTQKTDEPWLYAGEDGRPLASSQAEKLSRNQSELVSKIVHTVNMKLLPSCVILILITIWISIFLTHKIVGPFYHITKDLRSVDGGDLRTRIYLRGRDEGHVLAEAINGTLAGFDMMVTGLKRIVRKYDSDPEKMKTALKEELSRLKTTGE